MGKPIFCSWQRNKFLILTRLRNSVETIFQLTGEVCGWRNKEIRSICPVNQRIRLSICKQGFYRFNRIGFSVKADRMSWFPEDVSPFASTRIFADVLEDILNLSRRTRVVFFIEYKMHEQKVKFISFRFVSRLLIKSIKFHRKYHFARIMPSPLTLRRVSIPP